MIKGFAGGVHPPEHKEPSKESHIITLPVPGKVTIPLQQHTGAPCEALVEIGQSVKTGAKIGDSKAFISAPIHASISGKVTAIGNVPHPGIGETMGITIARDDEASQDKPLAEERDWTGLTPKEVVSIVREAGIVGMGGAAFPTHVKLSPPEGKKVELLIINGAECEPYLTTDEAIMLNHSSSIIEGIKIIIKAVGAERSLIALENNKPEAFRKMSAALKNANLPVPAEAISLHTRYPQGSEKQLIYTLTGREVPSGGLPIDASVLVHNVGTAQSIYEAVVKGKPLYERVLTVSGSVAAIPGNYLVRIGMSFGDVIEAAGGLKEKPAKVIMGGPMMGIAQYTLDAPVIKGTTAILLFSEKEIKRGEEYPCIRCGTCINACPMGLMPTHIAQRVKRKRYEEAKEDYHILDCIECGCCTYACPSKIPIIQYVRVGKSMLRSLQKK